MQFSPYLLFNGDCAEAFKFYEQTLGAGMCVDRFGIPWMVNCE
jgi:uncharacterized glyoxalase superfamily protein PhnB